MDLIKIVEEAFATPKKQFDEFGQIGRASCRERV